MKLNLIVSLLIAFFGKFPWSYSQQTSLFSLAYRDAYRFIPAMAGQEGTLFASGLFRNQWQSIEGHPQTFDFSANLPLYWLQSACGFNLGKDELGLSQMIYVRPSFNLVYKSNEFVWSAAVQLLYNNIKFQGDLARTPDGQYQAGSFDHLDPLVPLAPSNLHVLDGGISLALAFRNLQVGASLSQLFESRSVKENIAWRNRRHYQILIAYQWPLEQLTIKPQYLVSVNGNRVQMDFFTGIEYNGNVFGGIHFRGYNDRSLESVGISAGFSLSKSISLAYAHEFYLGKLRGDLQIQTQEFGLFYHFGKAIGVGIKPRIEYSPRYAD